MKYWYFHSKIFRLYQISTLLAEQMEKRYHAVLNKIHINAFCALLDEQYIDYVEELMQLSNNDRVEVENFINDERELWAEYANALSQTIT